MGVTFWASLVVGIGLGAANGALSVVIARLALTRPQKAFLAIVLGGMAVRMVALLVIVALVLLFVPVQVGPFVGGLLVAFMLGLVAEARFLMKRAQSTPGGDA